VVRTQGGLVINSTSGDLIPKIRNWFRKPIGVDEPIFKVGEGRVPFATLNDLASEVEPATKILASPWGLNSYTSPSLSGINSDPFQD
jgi:hypothetical protein